MEEGGGQTKGEGKTTTTIKKSELHYNESSLALAATALGGVDTTERDTIRESTTTRTFFQQQKHLSFFICYLLYLLYSCCCCCCCRGRGLEEEALSRLGGGLYAWFAE